MADEGLSIAPHRAAAQDARTTDPGARPTREELGGAILMRYRHSSRMRWPTVLMAIALAVALPKPVSAQELVTITDVTFERFGGLTPTGSPQIAVSITCDATGIIGDLSIEAEQRGNLAQTNLDLLDAACTTVPTRYVLQLDCFDCGFRPGPLIVVHAIAKPGDTEFGTGQRIVLRNSPLF
jgi:hypothetical protein